MTDKWEAGKTYVPGALVRPRADELTQPTLTNPDFEDGDTGWERNGGTWSIDNVGTPYHGAWDATCTGSGELLNPDVNPIVPGTLVTASCAVKSHGTTGTNMQVMLVWYSDAAGTVRLAGKEALGNGNTKHDLQQISTVTAPAPEGAASFRVGAKGTIVGAGGMDTNYSVCDFFSVSCPQSVPKGLIFKATQPAPGKSASVEPVWPRTTGVQVNDGEVIWEGVIATRLVWQAVPLLKSGAVEPAWPTDDSGVVHDGTIDWKAVSPRIIDPLCPASKIVTIAANKVFAADDDVVRYCATNNARDWSAPQDAGYIPTGQNAIGESVCTALGLYRGNLAAFTASSMQLWQVDPDPSKFVFLDAPEGIGTPVSRGHASVQGDLYFLSTLGVRSVSIAAGTANMAAGDIGTPVDEPVREDLATFAGTPLGIYLPSSGQYWLVLGARAWVFTYSPSAQIAAWGLYTFRWSFTDVCVLGGNLYGRTDTNQLVRLDTTAEQEGRPVQDDGQDFTVEVRWPYLDFGNDAGNLRTAGFDALYLEKGGAVGGVTTLAIGYDENNLDLLSDDVTLTPLARAEDGYVPLELTAPSISVKVTYTGPNAWELARVNVYTGNSWRAT